MIKKDNDMCIICMREILYGNSAQYVHEHDQQFSKNKKVKVLFDCIVINFVINSNCAI